MQPTCSTAFSSYDFSSFRTGSPVWRAASHTRPVVLGDKDGLNPPTTGRRDMLEMAMLPQDMEGLTPMLTDEIRHRWITIAASRLGESRKFVSFRGDCLTSGEVREDWRVHFTTHGKCCGLKKSVGSRCQEGSTKSRAHIQCPSSFSLS